MRRALSFGLMLLMALVAAAPAALAAGGRAALVIGVARYDRAPELKNSANDARDMALVLRGLGFDVTEVEDPDQRGMLDAISRFLNRTSDADVALFYYSGHGIQMGERNYLVPRDAVLESPVDVPLRSVDLGVILDGMETRAKVRVVLLDACRDNPFAALFRNRSLSRGLGSMSAALGTLVGFATSPGAVAGDGDGRNSPFAKALLRHLPTPGLDVTQLMRMVRADVVSATGGQQVPWDHSSLIGEISLAPVSPTALALAPASLTPSSLAPTGAPADPAGSPRQTPTTLAAVPPASADAQPSKPAVSGDVALAEYRAKTGQKAFAVASTGGWGYAFDMNEQHAAIDGAIRRCNVATGLPCRLSDVNGRPHAGSGTTMLTKAMTALGRRTVASTAAYADERRNFGVAAPGDLHTPYHEKTPLLVPGAAPITTPDLAALMKGPERPVLIDVRSGDNRAGTLPEAIWLKGAGLVGTSVDTLFPRLLDAVAPDKRRAVVFFCTGADCWLSWNASVRAARLGYRSVYWYRGGFQAWTAARLPVVPAELAGNMER